MELQFGDDSTVAGGGRAGAQDGDVGGDGGAHGAGGAHDGDVRRPAGRAPAAAVKAARTVRHLRNPTAAAAHRDAVRPARWLKICILSLHSKLMRKNIYFNRHHPLRYFAEQ